MKYSKSIEMYCANPIGEKEISEITLITSIRDSKINRQNSIYKSTCCLIFVASLVLYSYVVTMSNITNGLALFPVVFLSFLLITAAHMMILDIVNINHKVYINIFGVNFDAQSGFFDKEEVISSDQISSSLAKELILNINKQGRKMFRFERDIVKRLCEI